MYLPKAFEENDIRRLQETIRTLGAGTIVSSGPQGILASQVPIELTERPAPLGTIRFHLARANPQAKALRDGQDFLILFQGPQGYVSPSWYPSKDANEGKVVPTWNYVSIQVRGKADLFEGPQRLRPHLEALTNQHEDHRAEPWRINDAPPDFIDGLCRGIIGVELRVLSIEGKRKMSQNRPEEDRHGVAAGLRGDGRLDLLAEME